MALTREQRKRCLGRGAGQKIATRTKRTAGHVSQVIAGTRRDPVVEAEICKRLHLPYEAVFSTITDPAHRPIPTSTEDAA